MVRKSRFSSANLDFHPQIPILIVESGFSSPNHNVHPPIPIFIFESRFSSPNPAPRPPQSRFSSPTPHAPPPAIFVRPSGTSASLPEFAPAHGLAFTTLCCNSAPTCARLSRTPPLIEGDSQGVWQSARSSPGKKSATVRK